MGETKCAKEATCGLRAARHPALREGTCNDDCMNFEPGDGSGEDTAPRIPEENRRDNG